MSNLHACGRVIIGFMAALTLAGCADLAPSPTATPPPAVTDSPSTCHADGSGEMVLPDPLCTPGATNPDVYEPPGSRGNIDSTICKSGWTATVRPPESYTEPIKVQDIARYGDYAGNSTHAYELDHLIPLELGGAPRDPQNLWPEYDAGRIPNPKDAVEGAAKRAVCDGRMPLATAQQKMAQNWIELGHELGAS